MQTCLSQLGHNGLLQFVDLLSPTPVPRLYRRASTLPCEVGGNKTLSIVSFIVVQTQSSISSCLRSRSTASCLWMAVALSQSGCAHRGSVLFNSLPASTGALMGWLVLSWLRCAKEAIF